jgi:hypothetical protein
VLQLVTMLTNYSTVAALVASGAPLSPIEYVSWVIGSTAKVLNSTPATVDNSQNQWDPDQVNGNSVVAYKDPSTNVLWFCHVNYLGPPISGSLADLELSDEALAQLGIEAGDDTSWELYLVGAALVGVVVAALLIPPLAPLLIYAGAILGTGLGIIILGAIYATFTPQVVNTTCNSGSTACCLATTSLFGQVNTCFDCSSGTCNSTTTTAGGIGGTLISIGIGLAVVGGALVGTYAAYRHFSGRPHAPRTPRPTNSPTAGERAGSAARSAASSAYQQARGFYQALRTPPPTT